MKVNNCSFYTPVILNKNNNKMPERQNTKPVGFDYSMSEAIGRSQVNFTSKELDKSNKEFIDGISKRMNLSDNDKSKLENTVNKYLKKNNFSSVGALIKKEDAEEAGVFFETVKNAMHFSEEDLDTFVDLVFSRVMVNSLLEEADKNECVASLLFNYGLEFIKDHSICDKLTEKFNLDKKEEEYILPQLKRRRDEKIKSDQIAYEFIERYNLGYKDYTFIVDTINDADENFIRDFLAEENQNCDENP